MDSRDMYEQEGIVEEDDELILNEAVTNLKAAWVREACAPEILHYRGDLVDALLKLAASQQQIIDKPRYGGADEDFAAVLLETELQRIRYSIAKYLRTRLRKIEWHIFFLHGADGKDALARLSEKELAYARDYHRILEDHFRAECLDALPPAFQSLRNSREERVAAEPDLDRFVVCRANRDLGSVQIDDAAGAYDRGGGGGDDGGGHVQMPQGSVNVLRYRPVRDFVLAGEIDLM